MYKILVFLKRKPGMSLQDFRDYYESTHSLLGVKHGVTVKRYLRRYVTPFPDAVTGEPVELDFDVVTELWFDDEEGFRATFARISQPEVAAEIAADEENLFDRGRSVFSMVEEFETRMEHAS